MGHLIKALDKITEEKGKEWKFIEDTKERYVIFEDGSAYSLWLGNGKRPQWRKALKKLKHIHISQKGYHGIRIQTFVDDIKKAKNLYIHRLVALNFIENTNDTLVVNHISGIISDNTVENLEWCTAKENGSHASAKGLYLYGEQKPNVKYTTNEIITVKTLMAKTNLKNSEIARMVGVSDGVVSQVRRGVAWTRVKI